MQRRGIVQRQWEEWKKGGREVFTSAPVSLIAVGGQGARLVACCRSERKEEDFLQAHFGSISTCRTQRRYLDEYTFMQIP